MNTHPVTLAKKPLLSKKLLFLDGISRSGKKLSCRLLAQFKGIEYFQYISTVEKICHLHILEKLDAATTAEMLRLTIDEATYARLIGRNLNTRLDDESSIYRAPEINAYLKRTAAKDGDEAIRQFDQSSRTMLYHTHSVLEAAPLILTIFPGAQLIHVTRNPVDIAEDWLRRGWGERWGQDPRAFGLAIEVNGQTVPWHAAGWGERYGDLSASERCILSVLDLQKREQAVQATLKETCGSQFFQFALETLLSDPENTIRQISSFIQASPRESIASFLTTERLPNSDERQKRSARFSVLAANTRKTILDELLAASGNYDQQFNIKAL